jgi:hypothetical protein
MPDARCTQAGRPSTRAAVIMLIIIGIVVIAFVGMNMHDVTKTLG